MDMAKENMPETMYRASRCCRTLGNPTAYLILRCLGGERKTPSAMGEQLHIPLSTISMTLRHLRELDLVRYETQGTSKVYWIKDEGILRVLDSLESWVNVMREKRA